MDLDRVHSLFDAISDSWDKHFKLAGNPEQYLEAIKNNVWDHGEDGEFGSRLAEVVQGQNRSAGLPVYQDHTPRSLLWDEIDHRINESDVDKMQKQPGNWEIPDPSFYQNKPSDPARHGMSLDQMPNGIHPTRRKLIY